MYLHAIDNAARLLDERNVSGDRFDGFSTELRPANELDAYSIQAAAADLRAQRSSNRLAGYKIGATTPVMQQYLSIASPCAGRMLEFDLHRDGAVLSVPERTVLGVECELAVQLATDLPYKVEPYTDRELSGAIAGCMAAVEVVEDRYREWRELDASTLIADNFFHWGAVLGATVDLDASMLASTEAFMTIDDEHVGSGHGTDVLGDPLEALRWLASGPATLGVGLRAGQIVLLGSLVETKWVSAGSHVRIENSLLGAVDVHFVATPH